MSKVGILFKTKLILIILLWPIDKSLPVIVIFIHLLSIDWW